MTPLAAALLAAAPLFSFHSNVWMNLHHFLRAVARGEPAQAPMAPAEKQAWDAAVSAYRPYAQRDLVFDAELVAIKHELRGAEGKATLAGLKLDPALAAALEGAAPAYRRHFWPAHDKDNREWIALAEPQLAAHGVVLARKVAAAYGQAWPARPVPVDLSVQAGQFGAYTTAPPTHVVISSRHPNYRLHALEMLFHEASHAWDEVLVKGIERAAAAQGRRPPPQLWHAVLFFTAGELTRRELEAYGDEDYVEMALRRGNYDRACGSCRPLLVRHWGPRLDGRATIDEALSALVAAVAPVAAAPPPQR